MTPLWQIKPDALDAFLAEYPIERVQVEVARINGMPATWRATDDEKRAADEAAVEQQQLAQLTQVLPAIGKAANDLSQAEAASAAA
jgi:hypothetical protein